MRHNLPDGVEIASLRAFPALDPNTYNYVPITLRAKATARLLISDKGALLQLEIQWTADSAQLETLQKSLSTTETTATLLQPKMQVQEISVLIGDGQHFEAVTNGFSSNFPPYTTVFSILLMISEKEAAVAAFNGRMGFLGAHLIAALELPHRATIKIVGDAVSLVENLATVKGVKLNKQEENDEQILEYSALDNIGVNEAPKPVTSVILEDCHAAIKAAIEVGALFVEHNLIGETPESLQQETMNQAVDSAARQMFSLWRDAYRRGKLPSTATINATASSEGVETYKIEILSDVSHWFDQPGTKYISVSPVSLEEPNRSSFAVTSPTQENVAIPLKASTVHFDFDIDDLSLLPIRSVTLTIGSTAVKVTEFADPIRFETSEGALLQLTTNYTKGQNYTTEITKPDAQDWMVTLADLGMACIFIDASQPLHEKARQIQVDVEYIPSQEGTKDRKRFSFSNSTTQTAEWIVITRAPNLAGNLEYRWWMTSQRGTQEKGGPTRTSSNQLIL